MDGLFHGKPYEQMDDFGVPLPVISRYSRVITPFICRGDNPGYPIIRPFIWVLTPGLKAPPMPPVQGDGHETPVFS